MKRFPELDTLRGLAVLLMVLYHAAFVLDKFWGWPVLRSLGVGGWLLARTAAILFLLIAGISFAISWERTPPFNRLRKTLRRFFILTGAAALVSGATWLITPHDFVKFGILHLFALSTLLLPLFAPIKYWNGLLGLLIILIPHYYQLQTTNYKLLMPIGFPYPGFSSLDYFPFLPWFGIILIGSALAHTLNLPSQPFPIHLPSPKIFQWAGRRSLAIYLLHMPIILAILQILHFISQIPAG